MSTLNTVRVRTGVECNEQITWLETALMRLNYNQGLGFVVAGECASQTSLSIVANGVCTAHFENRNDFCAYNAGIVVDKKTLRNALITIAVSMSTAITALLALNKSVWRYFAPERDNCRR